IEIDMISPEPAKARLTGTRHGGLLGSVFGFHLRHHEGTVTLAGNHVLDQLFGTALTVVARCVNQRHAERKARAQRFFLVVCRTSSLPDMPGALPDGGDTDAVAKLDSARYARGGAGSRGIESQRARQGHRRTKRHATFIEFTPAQHLVARPFTTACSEDRSA